MLWSRAVCHLRTVDQSLFALARLPDCYRTCSVLGAPTPSNLPYYISGGGEGWLCGSAQNHRSEGSWFESRSWWFTDRGLILGMCHLSSSHDFIPNPPTHPPPTALSSKPANLCNRSPFPDPIVKQLQKSCFVIAYYVNTKKSITRSHSKEMYKVHVGSF